MANQLPGVKQLHSKNGESRVSLICVRAALSVSECVGVTRAGRVGNVCVFVRCVLDRSYGRVPFETSQNGVTPFF
jgi:hypothetical protein